MNTFENNDTLNNEAISGNLHVKITNSKRFFVLTHCQDTLQINLIHIHVVFINNCKIYFPVQVAPKSALYFITPRVILIQD